MKTLLTVLSVWTACLTVSADTDDLPNKFDATTGYVVQQFADATSLNELTSFTTNYFDSGKGKTVWNEDAVAPHADAKYYTTTTFVSPNDKNAKDDNPKNWVFAGGQLVMGSGASYVPMSVNGNHPVINNLFMLGGSKFLWYNSKNAFEGSCHIRRSDSTPIALQASQTITQDFAMDVDGDPAQNVIVRASINNSAARSATFNFTGDWSEYYGNILVTNCCFSLGLDSYTRLYVTGPSFPARVTVTTNCTFGVVDGGGPLTVGGLTLCTRKSVVVPAGQTLTIGDLAVRDEASFALGDATSKIVIASSCTFAEGAHLTIMLPKDFMKVEACEAKELSVLEFADGVDVSAIDMDKFTVVGSTPSDSGLPETQPELKEVGGKLTLTVSRRAIVSFTGKSIDSGVAGAGSVWFDQYDKSEPPTAFWSDGEAMHGNADYLFDRKAGDILMPENDGTEYEFPGSSLTLATANVLLKKSSGSTSVVDFKDVRVAENASIRTWGCTLPTIDGWSTIRLLGNWSIASGVTLTSTPYNSRCQRFDCEFSGEGTISVSSINSATSSEGANRGNTSLAGLNTNFTGRVVFGQSYSTVKLKSGESCVVPNEQTFSRLLAADGRNLGGPLDAFRHDSFWLRYCGCFQPICSLTLDQQNRGVLVSDVGQLMLTNGVTLTVMNPLTLTGKLIVRNDSDLTAKTGAIPGGTLALGGPLRFAASNDLDERGEPETGKNVIIASNVCVQALSTNSFDGAALSLIGSAAIVVDPCATGDLAAFGLVNTLGTIAVEDGDAATAADKVNVRVAASRALDAGSYTVAICTVPATSALTEESFAVSRVPCYSCGVTSTTTDAGKTFFVTLQRSGLMLMVR